ncbi:hypothetical protein GCM10023210_31050 [Chryseobacterium ginsengisoli]|uniref:Chromosomal replication initiator DnaA C-terminal domain-containing protein n=1 Tax=Chryseobacterium ginsengisoli TaxID=363853 RepID=A0ABP9MHJ3_9FLAO
MDTDFDDLIEIIFNVFGITDTQIFSKNRKSEICDVRKILAFELKNKGMGFQEIGMILKLHHTTVIHHVEKYKDRLKFDKTFKSKVFEFNKWKELFKRDMKKTLTLDNSKLLVLNNAMVALDAFNLQDIPKKSRALISICKEVRTDLLKKAVDKREKDKEFVLKLPYHKAEAIHDFLKGYEIYFPDDFGSYEANAILQITNELHRQLL